jgi:hypothetical protein
LRRADDFGDVRGAVFDVTPPILGAIIVDSFAQSPGVAGDCTLGEAIQAANTDLAVDGCPAGSGSDTIVLASGLYSLTTASSPPNGLPTITSDITIAGESASTTIIERAAGSPDFRILGVGGFLGLKT